MVIKVLVDTTYLLPTFGIMVENLTDEDLLRLRRIKLAGLVEYYCLDIIWIELLGKIYKELEKRRIDLQEHIKIAIRSLKESKFYTWISLTSRAIELACQLRKLGHKDIIDNLLYATSKTEDMVFMSMDDELKVFLRDHGFDTKRIMSHKELIALFKQ